jgi:type 1 fimbriae regulatory protein FimE
MLGPRFCNGRPPMRISRDFAEKGSKRESQAISPSAPAEVTAVGAARPTPENGKVAPPRRIANRERRAREHLTPQEVDKLVSVAGRVGRHGHRDATLILLAYRHGLRVSELVSLRWDQVDLAGGLVHVSRLKNGVASTHPLRGPELRALRRLRRDYPESASYVFSTERGGPLTDSGVRKIVARAGEQAQLGFPIHPHMLRHACGFKLANEGHDTRAIQHYLGHRNIQHTVRYTELAADRFKRFWSD